MVTWVRVRYCSSHYHGYQTVVTMTGKDLHSKDGETILRDEAELFLTSQSSNSPLIRLFWHLLSSGEGNNESQLKVLN